LRLSTLKRGFRLAAILAGLLCISCLTASLPKSAKVEPTPPPSEAGSGQSTVEDKSLVDTWELLYQLNEKGEEERPRESTRTLIEFTEQGKVIFNRVEREHADSVKKRSGKFTLNGNEISITDDVGNTVKWPYQVTGDTLVLTMPEIKKKFYWRRYR